MTDLAGVVLFDCDRQRARLSTVGCAKMWRKANQGDYRPQPYEGLHHCRGCSIGAANAGERVVVGFSELRVALGSICCRCRKPALRLIHGELCISCFNRDLEARKGRNAKGHAPALMKLLHRETVMVTDATGGERIVSRDRVLDLPELLIRIARRVTGPIRFSRVPIDPIAVAMGTGHAAAEELRDDEYITRSAAAELVGLPYEVLKERLERPGAGAPTGRHKGNKLMFERGVFLAWWRQQQEQDARAA